jgi:hypothetical protein
MAVRAIQDHIKLRQNGTKEVIERTASCGCGSRLLPSKDPSFTPSWGGLHNIRSTA